MRSAVHAGSVILAFVTAVAAGVPDCGAQEPAPLAHFATSVQVNVANVDVVVTDGGGRPVCGLTAADFALAEDGKAVALSNFRAPRRCGEPAQGSAPAAAGEPAPVETAAPAPEEEPPHVAIFVDNLNISNRDRNLVLEALDVFLAQQLPPASPVAVLSFDSAARERQGFSADTAVTRATLKALRRETTNRPFAMADRAAVLRDMALAGRGDDAVPGGRPGRRTGPAMTTPEQVLAGIVSVAEQQVEMEKRLLGALTRLVDSLAGIRGPKVLLFVSDGIPEAPVRELFELFNERFPDFQGRPSDAAIVADPRLGGGTRDVVQHANAGRVTFYTVNANADRGLAGVSSDLVASQRDLDTVDELNRLPSLFRLAASTGGQCLFSTPKLGASLGGLRGDLDASYSLGYEPDHFGDGTYHRIEVEVRRPGLTVRHREGYLDKPEGERLTDLTTAALLTGSGVNPLGLHVATGTPVRQGGAYRVPLTLALPAERLAFVRGAVGWEGRLGLCLVVADAEGFRSEPHRASFPLRRDGDTAETPPRGDVSFAFTILMAPGRQRLAVTARDEVARTDSTVVVGVTVDRAAR